MVLVEAALKANGFMNVVNIVFGGCRNAGLVVVDMALVQFTEDFQMWS